MAMEKRIKVGVDVVTSVDKNALDVLQQQLSKLSIQGKTSSVGKSINQELVSAGQNAEKLRDILDSAWNSKLNQLDFTKINTGIRDA